MTGFESFVTFAMTPHLNSGCAVCGFLMPSTQLSPLQNVSQQLHVLTVPGITCAECQKLSDLIGEVSGPVVSPSCKNICDSCRKCVQNGKIPKNALASGLWVGDVPPVLSKLWFIEKLHISKV